MRTAEDDPTYPSPHPPPFRMQHFSTAFPSNLGPCIQVMTLYGRRFSLTPEQKLSEPLCSCRKSRPRSSDPPSAWRRRKLRRFLRPHRVSCLHFTVLNYRRLPPAPGLCRQLASTFPSPPRVAVVGRGDAYSCRRTIANC